MVVTRVMVLMAGGAWSRGRFSVVGSAAVMVVAMSFVSMTHVSVLASFLNLHARLRARVAFTFTRRSFCCVQAFPSLALSLIFPSFLVARIVAVLVILILVVGITVCARWRLWRVLPLSVTRLRLGRCLSGSRIGRR